MRHPKQTEFVAATHRRGWADKPPTRSEEFRATIPSIIARRSSGAAPAAAFAAAVTASVDGAAAELAFELWSGLPVSFASAWAMR